MEVSSCMSFSCRACKPNLRLTCRGFLLAPVLSQCTIALPNTVTLACASFTPERSSSPPPPPSTSLPHAFFSPRPFLSKLQGAQQAEQPYLCSTCRSPGLLAALAAWACSPRSAARCLSRPPRPDHRPAAAAAAAVAVAAVARRAVSGRVRLDSAQDAARTCRTLRDCRRSCQLEKRAHRWASSCAS